MSEAPETPSITELSLPTSIGAVVSFTALATT